MTVYKQVTNYPIPTIWYLGKVKNLAEAYELIRKNGGKKPSVMFENERQIDVKTSDGIFRIKYDAKEIEKKKKEVEKTLNFLYQSI